MNDLKWDKIALSVIVGLIYAGLFIAMRAAFGFEIGLLIILAIMAAQNHVFN